MSRTVNDRSPNFRSNAGTLHVKRCFVCDPEHGRENWAPAVATGRCAWCGWQEYGPDTESVP